MKIKNGGPAFPTISYDHGGEQDGISIRDYFAAKAMQGICATLDNGRMQTYWLIIAEDAYKMADAMLAERANGECDE